MTTDDEGVLRRLRAPRGPVPIYHQLAIQLGEVADDLELAPGTPLPTQTMIARRLHLNRDTAKMALDVLVAQGRLRLVRGKPVLVR